MKPSGIRPVRTGDPRSSMGQLCQGQTQQNPVGSFSAQPEPMPPLATAHATLPTRRWLDERAGAGIAPLAPNADRPTFTQESPAQLGAALNQKLIQVPMEASQERHAGNNAPSTEARWDRACLSLAVQGPAKWA